MSLVFQHPDRIWLAAVIAAGAIIFLVRAYWRTSPRGSRWLAALVCKAAAWMLLASLLADPVWSHQQPKAGENEVVVMADNSASLNVAEEPGSDTRAARMKRALGGGGPKEPAWLEELGKTFRVRTQLADERVQTVADFQSLTHQGQRSDLSRALHSLREGGPGSRLAAVVLVSDGNPTDAAAWRKEGKGPIYSVLVGKESPRPDLAVTECNVTQTAFEDTPVTITAHVQGQGFAGKEIAVCAIDEKDKTVAAEKIRLTKDSEAKAVRLRVPAAKPGVSFFRVLVMEAGLLVKAAKGEWKAAAKETTLANNERFVAVDRGEGPYRVLYVSGRPNWEYKFLKRAISGDAEVQMPSLIRIAKREPKFDWRGRTGETSNPLFRGFGEQAEAQRYDQPVLVRLGTRDAAELSNGFPKAEEDLFGEYRAVILDDLEAGFFTQEQMHLLQRFVSERGGALLMLGGQESFQAGGYDHTPVGDMLPVYLDRTTQAGPVSNGVFNLTREGWLEPWTRLRANREDDELRVNQMPPFYSVNQVFSIKPGASVLATVTDAERVIHPALAAQRFGEGRVGALMIGDLWRWGMKDESSRNDLERSWRQLVRWLVVDVPDRIEFNATPDAGRVKLSVRVKDRAFRPQDDALVKIEVTRANAGSGADSAASAQNSILFAEPSLKEAGVFEAEFYAREAGSFRATARVENTQPGLKDAEKLLGIKATGWVHDPAKDEFANLAPGRAWMERIAQETGGQLLKLEDLDRLPALLKDIRTPIEETVTKPLWHTPWVFLLILGLLLGEWWLRRKGGLA